MDIKVLSLKQLVEKDIDEMPQDVKREFLFHETNVEYAATEMPLTDSDLKLDDFVLAQVQLEDNCIIFIMDIHQIVFSGQLIVFRVMGCYVQMMANLLPPLARVLIKFIQVVQANLKALRKHL